VGQILFLRFSKVRVFKFTEQNWSGRRGSNLQLSAWEAEFSILNFQLLQNAAEKMNVHALHTVHAVPEMRVAAGRLRDGVSHLSIYFCGDSTVSAKEGWGDSRLEFQG
jgi:hypothetical protein